jgi:hypothetical protein
MLPDSRSHGESEIFIHVNVLTFNMVFDFIRHLFHLHNLFVRLDGLDLSLKTLKGSRVKSSILFR